MLYEYVARPLHLMLETPSTNIAHYRGVSTSTEGLNSAIKFIRAYDWMLPPRDVLDVVF